MAVTDVKVELEGSESIELKSRRKLLEFRVNAETQSVIVYYRIVRYYNDGENDIVIDESEIDSYTSDYAPLFDSELGQAIKLKIETRLGQDDPKVQPAE